VAKKRIADKFKEKINGLREQVKMRAQIEAVKSEGYNAALDDVEKILAETATAQ
jgi:hypothetical protein